MVILSKQIAWNKVVLELAEMIRQNAWEAEFKKAIEYAHRNNIQEISDIGNLHDYLVWINDLLHWVPSENKSGREINNQLSKFYYILDQPPLRALQNHVVPHQEAPAPSALSAWMVRYAKAMGEFLDTPESLTDDSLRTFEASPNYNMREYLAPRGGWKTFNQFFARNFKPGMRPVAALCDPGVIVAPADASFSGQWEIRSDSQVTVKNLHWSIAELLEGSPYRDRFVNGIFMHAFLGPTDYHRQHAPVAGTVLEARVIPGLVYLEVIAEPVAGDSSSQHYLKPRRNLEAVDGTGYQFAQSRGLIVLDSAIGLVAVLPIGMCQVSSVVLTAEPGVTLRKGEEISYFQFGGSDIIVLFEARSNVCISAQPGVHYKMGAKIAQAYPVI